MHLVEIFLPVQYPGGDPVPEAIFELVQAELTEVFGGVTKYARGSARGFGRRAETLKLTRW